MNLSSRLFQIIEEEPVYCPILINIKCFKELYMLDKSEDKHKYAQHLVYIWYTCDPSSPYFNSEDKLVDAAMEVYGRKKVVTKVLKKCMDEYIKRQSTPMIRSYERAMRIVDEQESLLKQSAEQVIEFDRLIDDATSLMKTLQSNPQEILDRIELMERIQDLQTKKIKQQSDMSALIPKIKTQVRDLLEMKKDVDKDRVQVESDDNKEAISHFIVDSFIEKYT
jgi:hypothetical protein